MADTTCFYFLLEIFSVTLEYHEHNIKQHFLKKSQAREQLVDEFTNIPKGRLGG